MILFHINFCLFLHSFIFLFIPLKNKSTRNCSVPSQYNGSPLISQPARFYRLPTVTVHAYVPSNGICRGFAFQHTANSCCRRVFLRRFRFQKCLPVNSSPPHVPAPSRPTLCSHPPHPRPGFRTGVWWMTAQCWSGRCWNVRGPTVYG